MCIYQVFNGEKMYQGSGGSHGYSREEAIQYFKHGNGLDTHRFSSTAVVGCREGTVFNEPDGTEHFGVGANK